MVDDSSSCPPDFARGVIREDDAVAASEAQAALASSASQANEIIRASVCTCRIQRRRGADGCADLPKSAGDGLSFYWVRNEMANPALTSALPSADEAASPIRLLIVDDDEDLADTLAELLAARGFMTLVARDGEEALSAFARFRPQAALIDISMPVLNGRDLARRLREAGTDAKLIALSGHGRREDEEASLASGFDVHLVKPAGPDVIELHVRGVPASERDR